MAGPGQADDPDLRLGGVVQDLALRVRAAVVPAIEQAALQAGLLDFPLDPVRSRRRLALAAVTYVITVGACAAAWPIVAHWLLTVPPG